MNSGIDRDLFYNQKVSPQVLVLDLEENILDSGLIPSDDFGNVFLFKILTKENSIHNKRNENFFTTDKKVCELKKREKYFYRNCVASEPPPQNQTT